jgi:glycine/D-amino acid oxidase-like deaminating enzyme
MAEDEELARLVMAAQPAPFWLDRPDAPAAREPLRGDAACDLAVIGGGFSGLWTALLAKEANPGRSVVLIEGNRIGWAAQLAAVGWQNRQGVGDAGNQFHYYRLTSDNRILWGGYDAIYHFGGDVRRAYDQRPATFAKLAGHFFSTFPSWKASGSATAGVARSTPAAGSARSSAPRTAAGSPTRSATPGWGWPRPGSAPG